MNQTACAFLLLGLTACVPDAGPPVAVGTLERERVELVAEQSEPIVNVAVREGDTVDVGDLVLELDSRRMQAQVAAAEATASEAAARLAELVRGTRAEEIDEARARLAEAEGAIGRTTPDLERARNLVKAGVEPQRVLDQADAAYREALGARDAARATLEKMLNGATVEELDQARARVEESRAQVDERRVRLERLTVRAPRDGRIDVLPYELGEQPPTGGVVAVMLAGDAPYARVYVPAELQARARVGSAVTLTVDGVAGTLSGRVRTISAEASFTPFYALTERDRGRLVYLAEIDLLDASARELPTGLPVEADFGPPTP